MLAEQQNYFSIWDQSGNRYVPYTRNGPNFLRSWTNNWNVGSGVSCQSRDMVSRCQRLTMATYGEDLRGW